METSARARGAVGSGVDVADDADAALGRDGEAVASVLEALADQVGGWWAGEHVGQALAYWSGADDAAYRRHFGVFDGRPHGYEDIRIGYVIGQMAGLNPDYRRMEFDELEEDLRVGLEDAGVDFDPLRPFLNAGYERARNF